MSVAPMLNSDTKCLLSVYISSRKIWQSTKLHLNHGPVSSGFDISRVVHAHSTRYLSAVHVDACPGTHACHRPMQRVHQDPHPAANWTLVRREVEYAIINHCFFNLILSVLYRTKITLQFCYLWSKCILTELRPRKCISKLRAWNRNIEMTFTIKNPIDSKALHAIDPYHLNGSLCNSLNVLIEFWQFIFWTSVFRYQFR